MRPADIDWRQGSPFSQEFQDVYFSSDDGCEESAYVFLACNDLPARWQATSPDRRVFTIAETGFGTGLNFYLTLHHWLTTPERAFHHLHYVASEKHPFRRQNFIEIAEALFARWPRLRPAELDLFTQYPDLCGGFHQLRFPVANVTLTLMFGDNTEMYSQLLLPREQPVDAWYLDGFAPRQNPDMWSDIFFSHMARLSRPGTTFSTFTAASAVRRSLEQAGYRVGKVAGYGRKREMLSGFLEQQPKSPGTPPWFTLPAAQAEGHDVVVIGAGLAGSAVARQLAAQGRRVTVLERHAQPAREASGNLAGVIYPPISQQASAEYQYYAQAYRQAVRRFSSLEVGWQSSGVLQLAQNTRQQSRYQAFAASCHDPGVVRWVKNREARELAGVALAGEGLFFPQGGAINPPALCKQYLSHPAIRCLFESEVIALQQNDVGWQLTVRDGSTGQQRTLSSRQLVIATAKDVHALLPDYFEDVRFNRGQVSYLPGSTTLSVLKCVVCHAGYVTPAIDGVNVVGATVDETALADPRIEDHQANVEQLNNVLAAEAQLSVNPEGLTGNVAFRTVTTDHLPLVGPVPDREFYRAQYQDLRHGRPVEGYAPARYLPGLYISVAHGARGISSSLLAAEMIGAMMAGEALPVTRQVYEAVHPARFMVRALRKRV